jgi:hypothetical protein
MADPTAIQRAQKLEFVPPLDEGIKDIVHTLVTQGIETCESCQGGEGHSYPVPTRLTRTWAVMDGMLHGPWWEMTFVPSRPMVDH